MILTSAGPRSPDHVKQIRHCRLIRMEYWPFLEPRRASSRLLGSPRNVSSDGAALRIESRFAACRSKPWNAGTNTPAANISVLLSLYPTITPHKDRRWTSYVNPGGEQSAYNSYHSGIALCPLHTMLLSQSNHPSRRSSPQYTAFRQMTHPPTGSPTTVATPWPTSSDQPEHPTVANRSSSTGRGQEEGSPRPRSPTWPASPSSTPGNSSLPSQTTGCSPAADRSGSDAVSTTSPTTPTQIPRTDTRHRRTTPVLPKPLSRSSSTDPMSLPSHPSRHNKWHRRRGQV